ncbi:hemolymph proteinase 6 [Danaus plexippus plexippus]|uniref:trypsin n=1 Tax=Danaus plexippus plexippus TaxID=278856 RepID=A0A212FEM3_DANPL|nr:hemolymph proteinase 6 [Danaus plexippus plexippus]
MYIKLIVYCNLLILTVFAGEVDDKCTPNAAIKEGTCKLITDCEVALRSIKKNQGHPYARCGFSKTFEIVCCPNEVDLQPAVTVNPFKRTTSVKPEDKFGEVDTRTVRVADEACKQIIRNRLPPLGLHIIGGIEASPGEFPHMVALGYGGPDVYEFNCGASLLSELYALTAAHCVDTLNQIKPTIARMGVVELGATTFNPNTDYRVADILIHPDYLRRTKYHDLSLVRMERPAEFGVNIGPICLYTNLQDPTTSLTVTGWGKTSITKEDKSEVLLKANVTVVARSKCGQSYSNWRKLPSGILNEQICAGDPQGLRDTCQGDSGGPLQGLDDHDGQYRLVGVTSFGRGCGSPVPGVYTRVAHYLDWIESVVWPRGLDTWSN